MKGIKRRTGKALWGLWRIRQQAEAEESNPRYPSAWKVDIGFSRLGVGECFGGFRLQPHMTVGRTGEIRHIRRGLLEVETLPPTIP